MNRKTKKIISLILMSCLFSQISTKSLKVFADGLSGQATDVIKVTSESQKNSQSPIINSIEGNKQGNQEVESSVNALFALVIVSIVVVFLRKKKPNSKTN